MKAAVVSLINENERRQHIDSLFKKHNIEFDYFDAINKSQVDATLTAYKLAVHSDKMSKGEVACYLSHYCLWQRVIDQDLPYLMIFEDDIYFSKSASELLNNCEWLPDDFDVIKLETMYDRVMINQGVHLVHDLKLCHMQSRHMGMAGYIISQKGAKKIVGMIQALGIERPIDHIMFDELIGQKESCLYQVSPAICIQDKIINKQSIKFASGLEDTRNVWIVTKEKPSRSKKLTRELSRVYQQISPKNIYYSSWLAMNNYKKRRVEYEE